MTKFKEATDKRLQKRKYTIYRMWHESTPGVRYVGITTQDLIYRLLGHISQIVSGKNYCGGGNHGTGKENKNRWIMSLLERGLAPHIDELETHYGTFAEARSIEDDWMMHYLGAYGNHSFTLLNAKLPKRAQAIAKGVEQPVTGTTNYEIQTTTDNKQLVTLDLACHWNNCSMDELEQLYQRIVCSLQDTSDTDAQQDEDRDNRELDRSRRKWYSAESYEADARRESSRNLYKLRFPLVQSK